MRLFEDIYKTMNDVGIIDADFVQANRMKGPRVIKQGAIRKRIIEIQRNTKPFHEERGWRGNRKRLSGYYRTRRGSFAGKVEKPFCASRRYFIIKPPRKVLDGPHGACFREIRRDEFLIHMAPEPEDLDSGIRAVENTILEALS